MNRDLLERMIIAISKLSEILVLSVDETPIFCAKCFQIESDHDSHRFRLFRRTIVCDHCFGSTRLMPRIEDDEIVGS